MSRLLLLAAVVGYCGGLTGCASTWETATSRDFKEQPFHAMFGKKPDPLHVLRTSPEGYARADAMNRLDEPILNGGSQADQDEVIEHILGPAATSDPSPVVRAAAVDALGRFQDERASQYLVAAYHQADGRTGERRSARIQLAGGGRDLDRKSPLADGLGLTGPTGYPTEVSAALKAKAIHGLARTNRPDAVQFLASVAGGNGDAEADRDTRMAAVRALGTMKSKESVVTLAAVLNAEKERDIALAGRAHEGLVELTGKELPADPDQWNQVVQAGFELAP